MKKVILNCLVVTALVVSAAFTSYNGNEDNKEGRSENPFVGVWTGNGANVVVTDSTWTAQVGSYTYSSGTYTYEGATAEMTITDKGMSSASVGEKGSAVISYRNLVVSGFSDEDMNGAYSQ